MGTLFSNRTTSGAPDKGWPTFRVEVERKDESTGLLRLAVADSDSTQWRRITLAAPLRKAKWHSLLISWGRGMSLALIEETTQDARNVTISNRLTTAWPSSTPKVHFFGLGRVDNPFDHGAPLWTPPSLPGARFRVAGLSLGSHIKKLGKRKIQRRTSPSTRLRVRRA